MSNLASLLAAALVVGACAVALAACGSDSEPTSEGANQISALTESTTGTTAASATAAVKRARARRAARARHAAIARQAKRDAAAERQRRARARDRRAERQRRRAQAAPEQPAPTVDTTPAPTPTPPRAEPHAVTETASLKLVSKRGVAFVQEGSVTGTLEGTMRLDAKLGGKGVRGTFTVSLSDGTLTGTADAALTLDGSVANFDGTAAITQGTGAYAQLRPANVQFTGSVKSDASSSSVKLSGTLVW